VNLEVKDQNKAQNIGVLEKRDKITARREEADRRAFHTIETESETMRLLFGPKTSSEPEFYC